MLVVSSENSGCDPLFLFPGIDVTTSIRCHDLNLMSRPGSFYFYCISVSRPRFDVATSFLLSTSLILGRDFSFRLRHHSVVLSHQVGRNSNLLVFLFSCRDVDIRSRPSSFFNHCNSCRDLKSMPRPFFLPIQLQPHFSVSTVSIQFSISGRVLTVLPFAEIYVATSISCRDIITVTNYVDLCCDHVLLTP